MKRDRKTMILRYLQILAISSILCVRLASAQITVNGAIFNLKFGDRPVQNVIVGNTSKDPSYVMVTVEEILNPQEGGSRTQPASDLLVSPRAFSIQGNGSRTVRILRKELPGEKERVYRVAFAPQDRGFGQEAKITTSHGLTAAIRVLTGMGVLVYAEPANAHAALTWERTADSIVFKNSGNLHVQLSAGQGCELNTSKCEELNGKRVYGGYSAEIKVAGKKQVIYTRRDGASGDYQKLIIEPFAPAAQQQ